MPLVSRLSTTPVKGTALHHPQTVTVTDNGVLETRRSHLVDAQPALQRQQHGPLVRLTAEFDADSPHLRLRFPDRPSVEGRAADLGKAVCTDFYGRDVDGHLVEGPWSADVHPVTLISSATIEHLRCVTPDGGPLDHRRFRMLAEVDGCDVHEEDTWAGRRVRIGGPPSTWSVRCHGAWSPTRTPTAGWSTSTRSRRSCGTAASSPPT